MCCGQAKKKRLQFILKQINSLKTGVRHFRGGVSPLLLFEMDLKKDVWIHCSDVTNVIFYSLLLSVVLLCQ